MARLSPWLWTLAGALIGAGTLFSSWFWRLVSLISNQYITGTNAGWFLVPLGVLLVVFLVLTVLTARRRGAWLGLIGFGFVPAVTLYAGSVTTSQACLGPLPGIAAPSGYHCVYYGPPWYDSAELYVGVAFLVITLVGALIPLIPRITRARRSSHSANANGAARTHARVVTQVVPQ